jgi:hypothetical protein
MTGLMSTSGVPSTASSGCTRSRQSSTARTETRCSPSGFGRAEERVLNTPRSGPPGSSPGTVESSSRRARCSQVRTSSSAPTQMSRMPSRTAGSIVSQASGAPRSPWFGASASSVRVDSTWPIGRISKLSTGRASFAARSWVPKPSDLVGRMLEVDATSATNPLERNDHVGPPAHPSSSFRDRRTATVTTGPLTARPLGRVYN